MRLTEKKEGYIEELKTNGHIYFVNDIFPNNCKLTGRSIDKLGQLEDIEEELGIDLVTLFKALKNGIWIKKQSETRYPLALLRTHYSNNTTRYYVFDNGKEKEIKLNKYGKTWALTREELE